jgi:FliI/YscN family ATPase
MSKIVDFDSLKKIAKSVVLPVCRGRVIAVKELLIEAELPGSRVGMRVLVRRPDGPQVTAEIASCDGARVNLLPLAPTLGIGPGDEVVTAASEGSIRCGLGLLGRVIDPLGVAVDGGADLGDLHLWPLNRNAPEPLARKPIDRQLVSGIRAIDGCLTLGLGQRIGLFAGPGAGKSTLLGSLARRADCDAAVVCLVGERGREVKEFITRNMGDDGLAKSTVVLAPADAPPLIRVRALTTATAVAEWFRAEGKHVLLLVDSLTRVLRARRDVALALGEAPARGGFPASAFASLPSLLERAGRDALGSITAVYAVLTEGGDNDPVAEETRALLDGHIVLSQRLARSGHWPAIDIPRSVSRVMSAVASPDHVKAAEKLRRVISSYEEHEDLILMGAYRSGASPDTDHAIRLKKEITAFLRQGNNETSHLKTTLETLFSLVEGI